MDIAQLDEVTGGLRRLAGSSAVELSDAVVTEELVALRRLADAAEAAYALRLRVFDQRRIAETESVLSTRAWVRERLHVAPGETSRVLKIAKRLMALPVVERALVQGEIRLAHASAIADAVTLLGVDVIAGCQDALVEAASEDDPTRLRAALRALGAAVDSKRAVKRAEREEQGRWLDLATTFQGALSIGGVLPGGTEAAAVVTEAIDSLAGPAGADDDRTPTQRRADALVELCRRQLRSGDLPAQGGEPAQVNVIVDLSALEARTGGFAELTDGGVVSGDTARRLACDARISRVITGPAAQPLDVGRSQRTVTRAQRKALRVRDRHCRFPGCQRPFAWTDAHHVIHWAHGGPTDLDNLISLCRTHHTAVHEGGWRITTVTSMMPTGEEPSGTNEPGGPGSAVRFDSAGRAETARCKGKAAAQSGASVRFVFVDPNGCPVPDTRPRSTATTLTRLIDALEHPAGTRTSSNGASDDDAPGDAGSRVAGRGLGEPVDSEPGAAESRAAGREDTESGTPGREDPAAEEAGLGEGTADGGVPDGTPRTDSGGQAVARRRQTAASCGQPAPSHGQPAASDGQAAASHGQATPPRGQMDLPDGQANSPEGQATPPEGQTGRPVGPAAAPGMQRAGPSRSRPSHQDRQKGSSCHRGHAPARR